MIIQPITQTVGYTKNAMPVKERGKAPVITINAIPQDTYEPKSESDRTELLKTVKSRIKSGYYHSQEVLEDLSDSFAKVFNTL
jgi:hypothetical protein